MFMVMNLTCRLAKFIFTRMKMILGLKGKIGKLKKENIGLDRPGKIGHLCPGDFLVIKN